MLVPDEGTIGGILLKWIVILWPTVTNQTLNDITEYVKYNQIFHL